MNEMERKALDDVRVLLASVKVYTVEKILGIGAAGVVLKVRHRVFGQRAMKLIHPNLLRSRIIRTRFDNEARIMNTLTHPHVVKVHELGEVGDYPYIVMDFLEGGTLEDHFTKFGKMPPKQAVRVAIGILHGLQVAHEAGVIHRDIKPQNILFDKNGTPKIADFGIARVEEGTRSMTREGATMGTFAYMPPEQLEGEIELIDARSDVHAVGVTLYVMLTCGKLGQEAFFRQMEKYPERLSGIEEILKSVILKATSEHPENRFKSAAAMADELELHLATDLPEDSQGTPSLGSAPFVLDEAAAEVPNPILAPMGATIAPLGEGSAHSQHSASGGEGGHVMASQGGFLHPFPLVGNPQKESGEDKDHPLSLGTIHPPTDDQAEKAEVEVVRMAAKRRFLTKIVLPVVGVLVMLGVGAWFATKPVSPPLVETLPESVIEPIDEQVSAPELAVSDEEPVDQLPDPIAKTKSTPSVRVNSGKTKSTSPSPQPALTEISVSEVAQVRLVLKPDTTATLTLTGDGGTFTLTGGSREVPTGTYRVSVDMPGRETPQAGTLVVPSGLTVITCDSRFGMCTGIK
jgi:serine/threonine protein kinase